MNIRGLLIAGACIALSAASALAQQYTIQSSVIGSGGGPMSNGTYSMNGTVGQTVIGPVSNSQYAVGQGFWHNATSASSVPTPGNGTANGYELDQNFPNPFNPSTTITFSIPERQKVTLKIMNLLGEEIERAIDGVWMEAGQWKYEFQASNIPSGTYIYRLEAGNFVKTRKMVLTK